jgi:hypothetical protein
VPERQRTEASTWVNVSDNAGTAAGTAAAGLATGISGRAPFLLASVLSTCAAVVAAGVKRVDAEDDLDRDSTPA